MRCDAQPCICASRAHAHARRSRAAAGDVAATLEAFPQRHSTGALQDKLGVAYAGIADTFRRVHRVRCERRYALIHTAFFTAHSCTQASARGGVRLFLARRRIASMEYRVVRDTFAWDNMRALAGGRHAAFLRGGCAASFVDFDRRIRLPRRLRAKQGDADSASLSRWLLARSQFCVPKTLPGLGPETI